MKNSAKTEPHHAEKNVNNYGNIATQNNFYIQDMHGNISLDRTAVITERIISLPLSKNKNYVGRASLLTQLHDGFAVDSAGYPVKQVISGLGGIGKTQFALKYVYEHLNEYKSVCWVECANDNAVFRTCSDFLSMVGVPLNDNVTSRFTHWFQTHDDWLLVLDDVSGDVSYLLPKTGKGDILITTRQSKDANITLESMDIDEAVNFLVLRTGLEDAAGARKLASRLGCLPLALEQAAAYIAGTDSVNFDYYLKLIKELGLEVFDENDTVESYNSNVKTVWRITLDRLSDNARHILYCLAYMSPDLLALDLLTKHVKTLHPENEKPDKFIDQIGKNGEPTGIKVNISEIFRKFRESKFSKELIAVFVNDIKRDKAVAELKRFSLVMVKSDKTITMHRLLQEVIRSGIDDCVYLLSVAEMLKRLCGEVNWIWNDYRIAVTIQQAKALVLNIDTILQYRKEYDAHQGIAYNDIWELPFEQHSLMAQYLFLRGVDEDNAEMLENADECYKRACEIGEQFYGGGKDSKMLTGASTFTVIQEKHRRMKVNLVLNRIDVARNIFEEVRTPVSKSLDRERGMSFYAFNNFGDLWYEFGFLNEAKECYEIALKIGISEEEEMLIKKITNCENGGNCNDKRA